jgi:CBS domain-containing protein
VTDDTKSLPTTVHTAPREISAKDVARVMTARGIGAVVVVDGATPIGMVTDRDIVVRVIAAGLDPTYVLVGAIMSAPLVKVLESESLTAAIALMGQHGVRRLPIVNDAGGLVSILTLDDLLRLGLASAEDLAPMIKEYRVPLEPLPDAKAHADVSQTEEPAVPVQPVGTAPPTLAGPVVNAARPTFVIPMVSRRRRRSLPLSIRRGAVPDAAPEES